MSDTRAFWNERFGSSAASIYGEAPNDFLVEHAHRLEGRVLSLGEGEGRNAVFLARRGLDVTALDISEVGLAKTSALARQHGVTVHTRVADLSQAELEPGEWDGIISIW
jgi:cyclopropane fatty-acyl-phospholipid synthase-like methyltransferase